MNKSDNMIVTMVIRVPQGRALEAMKKPDGERRLPGRSVF